MRQIVDGTAELVELGCPVRDDEIVILPDSAYPAYGVERARGMLVSDAHAPVVWRSSRQSL